jgi:hypothetical protein
VKIIDEARNKALYIELDSKKGYNTWAKKKPTRKETRRWKPQPRKGGILIGIANIVMWMGT